MSTQDGRHLHHEMHTKEGREEKREKEHREHRKAELQLPPHEQNPRSTARGRRLYQDQHTAPKTTKDTD